MPVGSGVVFSPAIDPMLAGMSLRVDLLLARTCIGAGTWLLSQPVHLAGVRARFLLRSGGQLPRPNLLNRTEHWQPDSEQAG